MYILKWSWLKTDQFKFQNLQHQNLGIDELRIQTCNDAVRHHNIIALVPKFVVHSVSPQKFVADTFLIHRQPIAKEKGKTRESQEQDKSVKAISSHNAMKER